MKVAPSDKATLLARAAVRLSTNPEYMAHVLRQLAQGQFSVESLAQQFSIDEFSLIKLALSKRPRTNPESFAADVQSIAKESGVGSGVIANLVRRADALVVFRHGNTGHALAAARDTVEKGETESESGNPDEL